MGRIINTPPHTHTQHTWTAVRWARGRGRRDPVELHSLRSPRGPFAYLSERPRKVWRKLNGRRPQVDGRRTSLVSCRSLPTVRRRRPLGSLNVDALSGRLGKLLKILFLKCWKIAGWPLQEQQPGGSWGGCGCYWGCYGAWEWGKRTQIIAPARREYVRPTSPSPERASA